MSNDLIIDLSALEEIAAAGEQVQFDADADYSRPAPPTPDGIYLAFVKVAGVGRKGEKTAFRTSQWKNESTPHFETTLSARLVSENAWLNDKFVWSQNIRTKIDPDKGNTSEVIVNYKGLTGKPIPGTTEGAHMKALIEAATTEVGPVYVHVKNELHDTEAEIEASRSGEKRPKAVYGQKAIEALEGGTNSLGNFTGVGVHPQTGNRCIARPVLVRVYNTFDAVPEYLKKSLQS